MDVIQQGGKPIQFSPLNLDSCGTRHSFVHRSILSAREEEKKKAQMKVRRRCCFEEFRLYEASDRSRGCRGKNRQLSALACNREVAISVRAWAFHLLIPRNRNDDAGTAASRDYFRFSLLFFLFGASSVPSLAGFFVTNRCSSRGRRSTGTKIIFLPPEEGFACLRLAANDTKPRLNVGKDCNREYRYGKFPQFRFNIDAFL